MADPIPISEPHLRIQPKPIKKSKSCSNFILKFLFLSLLFIVLPLFPSQAPEFFSQKTLILTKLWELLHLLFIGIVVAYGLFSTRNCELESNLESQSSNNNAPSYVSKFFPASTIFGDESENSNGFDENKMMHCWNNNQYFDGSNEGSTVGVFDEQYNNTQLPNSDENFGYSVRFDNDNDGNGNGTNVVQAWNSEYCYSEPVVVAQPYYGCGEFGEVVGYKPLGLPVRSLKLVEREVDGCEYVEGSDSSLGSRSSLKRLDVSDVREFEDLVPSNLEKKFNDVANVGGGGMVSSIQWNSRFRRMEREKVYGNVTDSLQFRPVLVDEMNKFEGVGLRSSQSTASFSLPASMHSSFDSIASDNVYMDFQMDGMRQKEATYVPDASEKMNFLDKEMRRRKNSYVPPLENVILREEDTEQRMMNSCVAAVQDSNFQRRDLGKKVSLRNRRMGSKGKHVDFTYPANFRPMSVDETQFESRNLESFESTGSFPSNMRMYGALDSVSSDTIDFQEEDMRQKESFPVHTSENMNFEEENVHASENVNFQEEDLGQKNNPFVHVSEDMNFQEVDLVKKISQVSRNEMMETRGKYAAVSRPSHLRPISVDETQLESHSSRSLQSRGSFSSQTSLRSSVDSISSENMNSLQEALGEKKSLHGSSSSSSSSSPSHLARRNGETSLQAFEGRGYNIDSLLKDDPNSNLNNDDLRDKSGIGVEDDHLGNKDSTMHGLHSDSDRPISLAKALSRGKSVRTRRANGMTSGTTETDEASSKQADEKLVKKPNNVDNVVMRKDKIKSREPDLLLKGISKKTLDCYFPKHEATFSSHRKRDKPEPSKNVSSKDLDIKLENNVQGSSDEDVVSEYVNDSGLDSEVDKKASEFIAKFKAQIRLQKTGSIERSKGQKIFGDNVR